jgi:hypothetical protein
MGRRRRSHPRGPSNLRSFEWWIQQVVPAMVGAVVAALVPLVGVLIAKIWAGSAQSVLYVCLSTLVLGAFVVYLRAAHRRLRRGALGALIIKRSSPLPMT